MTARPALHSCADRACRSFFPHAPPPRLVACLLLALPAAVRAAGLEIVRVFTGWRDAASFQSMSEYLDGGENTGGVTVLRTRPAERAGFYWLVRLKNDGPAARRGEVRTAGHHAGRAGAEDLHLPRRRARRQQGL